MSQEISIYSPDAKAELLPDYSTNRASLATLDSLLSAIASTPGDTLERVEVEGWASPSGKAAFNKQISAKRAEVMRRLLIDKYGIPADKVSITHFGIDFETLAQLVKEKKYRYADEVVSICDDAPAPGQWDTRKSQLMSLRGGTVWKDLAKDYFRYLRRAAAINVYYKAPEPEPEPFVEPEPEPEPEPVVVTEITAVETDTVAPAPVPDLRSNRYWSIHTNMLYDALLIPNIGLEVYLGKNFSLAANWWYAWWKTDRKHRYWCTYGGYIAPRWWFGKLAHKKPLTGHHLGLYGQIILYDFEWGGTGYLSGGCGKNIFYRPTWAAGIEYGFALPIGRRLNIDFTLGLGYMEGRYLKYKPMDGHYVWQSTHQRRWFGPTKLEISLVWLLGHGNVNEKKGGEK